MIRRALLLTFASWASLSVSKAEPVHSYPDSKKTPGDIDPAARQDNLAQTVCSPTWVVAARNVTHAEKRDICVEYGIMTGCPGPRYEIDHFVPVSSGGSNSPLNLWVQPIEDAKKKDLAERWVHTQVCNGSWLLIDAQRMMMINWVKIYDKCCAKVRP